MKIQFLGTGAAEGWPGLFCQCDACMKAKALGGKNIRTRSSCLINDAYLVDFPPDTYMHMVNNNLDLGSIEHLFITHSHRDHFFPYDLLNRKPGFAHLMTESCLNIYGNDAVVRKGNEVKSFGKCPDEKIMFHEVPPFETFKTGDMLVTPLLATHDRSERCYIYIFETGGQKLLYGHDSGIFRDETWNFIDKNRFDAVIFECTMGIKKEGRNHMGVEDVLEVKKRMKDNGSIDSNTRLYVTHFSHNGKLLHHELEEIFQPHGIEVAYDGKTVEF